MGLWSCASSCFVLLLIRVSEARVPSPGEIARTSCALAQHDCSRKGRRPLRAGGSVLPRILDSQWRLCGSLKHRARRTAAEDLDTLFEAAILNSTLELRPHLATLLEYSKRARSVLQVGSSDAAWIAVVKGGLERSEGQVYQTELPANLLDFLEQHDLSSLGISILEGHAHSEMLFFSAWKMEFESLAAKSAAAKFILIHGTKSSGENQDIDSGFVEELQKWLSKNKAWQLTEYSALGAGLAVLSRENNQRPSNCSDVAWAHARSFASELLKVQHDYPSPLGSTWHVNLEVVRAMQRKLASIQNDCPDAKAALQVLRLFRSKDPEMLQGLIRSSFNSLRKRQAEISAPAVGSSLLDGEMQAALQHPELSLLVLYRGQLATDVHRKVIDASLARWPHRPEFWQILAKDLAFRQAAEATQKADVNLAMHAIRRCFSLRHFDRAVISQLLEMLEVLRRPLEAGLLWAAVAGSPTAPWDDLRRSSDAAVSVVEVAAQSTHAFPGEAFYEQHPEFKFAKDYMEAISSELLEEQLNIVRSYSASEVNGYCKQNGWCEYMFLHFEHCKFLSECRKVPKTCKAAQKMEEKGLRMLRASLSLAGSPEVEVDDEHRRQVYIQPHASVEIGRMRLSCTLLVSPQTSSTLRIEGEIPKVYRQGKCFWFDESMTHEMDFEATGPDTLRATLYLDALHPAYHQQREVHYYPVENSLPWWQAILENMGKPWPLLRHVPHRFLAPPSLPAPWISFAVDSSHIRADVCLRGDLGLLFHQNAFWTAGDRSGPLVTLQLFSRIQTMLHLGKRDPDLMKLAERNRQFTQQDLDELTLEPLSCIAMGCQACQALELFGLCLQDLNERVLLSLFGGLAQTLHLDLNILQSWLGIFGFSFPPPGGYGLTAAQFEQITSEKRAEIETFFRRHS